MTFWTIETTNDSNVYDIRTETKAEAIAILNQSSSCCSYSYELEQRRYKGHNLFDLVDGLLGEGRGYYEVVSSYDLRTLSSVKTEARLTEW